MGGEVGSYVKLLEDARRQALDRMVQNATAMGANAVTMMRFDSSEIGNTMSEIVAYGTAGVHRADGPAGALGVSISRARPGHRDELKLRRRARDPHGARR